MGIVESRQRPADASGGAGSIQGYQQSGNARGQNSWVCSSTWGNVQRVNVGVLVHVPLVALRNERVTGVARPYWLRPLLPLSVHRSLHLRRK